MARRAFLTRMAQLAAFPFITAAGFAQAQPGHKKLKILMKSAWAPTIPPRPRFLFRTGWPLPKLDTKCRSICSAKLWF